jgi:hypothetical protein
MYTSLQAWHAVVLSTGVIGQHVTSEDCSRMYSIATRVPPLPSMRFVGLVTDFANIARGEMTGDVLIAYEV